MLALQLFKTFLLVRQEKKYMCVHPVSEKYRVRQKEITWGVPHFHRSKAFRGFGSWCLCVPLVSVCVAGGSGGEGDPGRSDTDVNVENINSTCTHITLTHMLRLITRK